MHRIFLFVGCILFAGCNLPFASSSRGLPSEDHAQFDQLLVHADFKLPSRHRLLEELTALRGDVAQRLRITPSDEPINVYLFEDRERFESYMLEKHPDFPLRRAFFVKNDTTLNVYAYWGDKVAEDLRHEVTHGYLHATFNNMPLWLDEGLAEFHEVPRGRHGMNWNHIELLYNLCNDNLSNDGNASTDRSTVEHAWSPDIHRLDSLIYPDEMTQQDYAESWLWTHFMLESEPFRIEYLRAYVAQLNDDAETESLSEIVARFEQTPEDSLLEHLQKLHSLQK